MKTEVLALNRLFGSDVRYVLPHYQRPYVWEEDRHWAPLWGDIENLLDRQRSGSPLTHFMGAVVLQQETTQPGEVPRHLVIDGQQRLTTLQLLLAAAAVACDEVGAETSSRVIGKLVKNDPDLAQADDRFKVWPTEGDRQAFGLVMEPGGPPGDAEDDPTNSIQESFDFFVEHLREWLGTGDTSPDELDERGRAVRIVLSEMVQLVSISLETGDDPQVIFETLNARGTPLLAMDLVKNALFHRLAREDVDALHDNVWLPELGQEYWRKDERQGRLTRPRAELFLMHWLAMKLRRVIRAADLFPEFRSKILDAPDSNVSEILTELASDAKVMREFDDIEPDTPEGRYFRVLSALETSTFLPVTLWLHRSADVSAEQRIRALQAIESFLVRRLLMCLSTKQYNRLGIDVLEAATSDPRSAGHRVAERLAASGGLSTRWPQDDELRNHLRRHPMFGWVSRQRLALIFGEIELALRGGAKTEDVALTQRRLSIEHLLPQKWRVNWPLPEGHDEDAEDRRDSMKHTIGNLTIVTGSLNSGLSNSAWADKKAHIGEHSVLKINNDLLRHETWNEDRILERADWIADEVIRLWPGPSELCENFDPEAAIVPTGELSPDHAEMDDDQMEFAYRGGSDVFRALLDDLCSRPDERRSFEQLETALGWSRGRLASVLGGYGNRSKQIDGKRPYRLVKDEDGNYWMWVDAERAEALRRLSREHAA